MGNSPWVAVLLGALCSRSHMVGQWGPGQRCWGRLGLTQMLAVWRGGLARAGELGATLGAPGGWAVAGSVTQW